MMQKSQSFEVFWDVPTLDPVGKSRRNVGRPRGVMTYRAVMTIALLEECLDRTSVHSMKFKNTFFYSIKKHLGRKSYKQFRKTVEKNNPIKKLQFLDEKWLADYAAENRKSRSNHGKET